MPWTSKGFDKDRYNKLMETHEIKGIPTLIVLKADGETAAEKNGRGDVSNGVIGFTKWVDLVKE